jgi:glucose-1-phosphate adenylyltransferase
MHVPLEETHRFGIMTTNKAGRIIEFHEKPTSRDKGTLANMGVYLFKVDALAERLRQGEQTVPDLDFGKHIIPGMVPQDRVYAYQFDGYWVDVGTVDAYWRTSLGLCDRDSPLNLWDPNWVIRTRSEERPPAKTSGQASVERSLVSNGCTIQGAVHRSVLSPGVFVSSGAVVRDSVVMNDTWIGPGAVVDHAVVDKDVLVGGGTQLGWGEDKTPNQEAPDRLDTGITVVGKGAHIPGGARIGRNVLVNADVDEDDFAVFADLIVPSGATITPAKSDAEELS